MVRSKGEAEEMAAGMKRWNQEVIDTVPSERLLVWWPTDGWEPLCEFLEVPVPDQPVPNVNDTENFQKNLIMAPAIAAINAWWEENKALGQQPGHLDASDKPAQSLA
jgi:Sulfotransferase domain